MQWEFLNVGMGLGCVLYWMIWCQSLEWNPFEATHFGDLDSFGSISVDSFEIQQESTAEFSASMFTAKLCPGVPIGDSIQQSETRVTKITYFNGGNNGLRACMSRIQRNCRKKSMFAIFLTLPNLVFCFSTAHIITCQIISDHVATGSWVLTADSKRWT